MNETYSVCVSKEHLIFSAAHFITFNGNVCERIHGHNYRVSCEVHGPLDENEYVYDFIAIRDSLKEITERLDHHVLLPTEHAMIRVAVEEGEVVAKFEDRRWVFPTDDCVLLPVKNTTAEALAKYIGYELIDRLRRRSTGQLPQRFRIGVDENEGQWAYCEICLDRSGNSHSGNRHLSSIGVCEPDSQEWPALLEANVSRLRQREVRLGGECLHTMRRQVLDAAAEYTAALASIATSSGLPFADGLSDREASTSDALTSGRGASDLVRGVVATGHQPTIFHPGILAKNQNLSTLIKATGAIGLMVAIDTDEEDAGQFAYPTARDGIREIRSASLATGSGLVLSQRVSSAQQISDVRTKVSQSLRTLGLVDSANRAIDVLAQYEQLTGQSIVVANSIIRRRWEDRPSYIELPLSRLVELTAIRNLLKTLVLDAKSLHKTYNWTLSQYREAHGIRNRANPFPTLRSEGNSIELPFWVIDPVAATRTKMFVDLDRPEAAVEHESQIAPRGMMITTLLRLVVSDLFIHGTGGAKYDRCTDEFIKAYFGLTPPRFVTATRDATLFSGELDRIEKTNAVLAEIRDRQQRFQSHVSAGTFDGSDGETARCLLARRLTAIDRLKQAKTTGESAADIHHDLKAVDSQIKRFVHQTVAPEELMEVPSKEEIALLRTREFPFFFFAQNPAR